MANSFETNQMIITGKTILDSKLIDEIRTWSQNHLTECLSSFLHPGGTIGYIGTAVGLKGHQELLTNIELLMSEFPFIEIGITVLNGPPKSYNLPLVSLLAKNGKVKKDINCHIGHPAPKNYRKEQEALDNS